jgi:hypothetical protein
MRLNAWIRNMMNKQNVISWLLDSDPSIRWQVMKDVLQAGVKDYEAERDRLPQDGWCARILLMQDENGLWNRSLYNGKWISTTYSLYLLKILGLSPVHPQALKGCNQLMARGLYEGREIRFSRNRDITDRGVTALVLSICCYFGFNKESLSGIADFLARNQGDEGNWLPNESPSASAYTFETTLLVLEALAQYRNRQPTEENSLLTNAVERGQEFLLRHNVYLFQGKPVKSAWTSFSFPPYWFFDVLTALEYFCSFRMNRDPRIQGAIDLLLTRRTRDGRWLLGRKHPGKTYFDMETPEKPSRWNTLRALRVMEWWNRD